MRHPSIFGQLVGTRKIQDGCRDPGKFQNVFIFTLHHVRNIIFRALAYEEFNGTDYNSVRLCSCDQNSKWPPFSPTIAKIEHNLIDLCYINIILFCPYPGFIIPLVQRNHFH